MDLHIFYWIREWYLTKNFKLSNIFPIRNFIFPSYKHAGRKQMSTKIYILFVVLHIFHFKYLTPSSENVLYPSTFRAFLLLSCDEISIGFDQIKDFTFKTLKYHKIAAGFCDSSKLSFMLFRNLRKLKKIYNIYLMFKNI